MARRLPLRLALDVRDHVGRAAEGSVIAEALQHGERSHCGRAARWYAKRGLRVHPLRHGSKLPLLPDWQRLATADVETIDAWFQRWPDAGVGIATGCGLFAVDVDPRHDGDESLRELEDEHGELPETWRSQTAGGGSHLYFRTTAPLRNRAGVWRGVDIRGDGGYVVAPPTVLSDGRSYVWACEHAPHEVPLADAPAWLLGHLARRQDAATPRPPDEWARLVRDGAGEGTRNEGVARLAGYLLRRRPAPRVVLELVRAWNESRCRPPLSDEEIVRTVDSICRAEAERRLS